MNRTEIAWRWFLAICGTIVAVVGWNFLVLANLLAWAFGDAFPKLAFWSLVVVSIPAFGIVAHRHFFGARP